MLQLRNVGRNIGQSCRSLLFCLLVFCIYYLHFLAQNHFVFLFSSFCIYRTIVSSISWYLWAGPPIFFYRNGCFSYPSMIILFVIKNQLWSVSFAEYYCIFLCFLLATIFFFSTVNPAYFSTTFRGHWRLLYCMLFPLWELKSLLGNLSRWIKWLNLMIGACWFFLMVALVLSEGRNI